MEANEKVPNANIMFRECTLKLNAITEDTTPNPWSVQDASVFLRYHCPECPMVFKKLDIFGTHSTSMHPRSKELFCKVKPDKIGEVYQMVENEIKSKFSQDSTWPDETQFKIVAKSVVQNLKYGSKPKDDPRIVINVSNVAKINENKENNSPVKSEPQNPTDGDEVDYEMYFDSQAKFSRGKSTAVYDGKYARKKSFQHENYQEFVKEKMDELHQLPAQPVNRVVTQRYETQIPNKDKGFFPFTKIAIDIKTKEFRCMECHSFTGAQKFDLVTHFLEKHGGNRFNFEICQWCQEVYENCDRLENHHKKVHPGIPRKVYMCEDPICKFEGKYTFTKLRQHMTEEHFAVAPYVPFKCDQCDAKFLVHEELSNHMNVKHRMNLIQFQCETCPMAYYDRTAYFIHKKSHNKNFNLFFCEHCNEPQLSRYDLFTHHAATHRQESSQKKHAKFPFFACELCKFYDLNDFEKLIEHMENEHNVLNFLPIPCLIDGCQEKFEDLKQHYNHKRRSHKVFGQHLCTYCGKIKKTKEELKSHIKGFHEVDKTDLKFACDQCDFRHWRKLVVKNHNLRVHQKDKHIPCQYCGETFLAERFLLVHIDHHHKGVEPILYECPDCKTGKNGLNSMWTLSRIY